MLSLARTLLTNILTAESTKVEYYSEKRSYVIQELEYFSHLIILPQNPATFRNNNYEHDNTKRLPKQKWQIYKI